MVVTAARHWTLSDGTLHPTGFWAEELAEPHRLFREAGWAVTIATPGGVEPVVDQLSLGRLAGLPWVVARAKAYLATIAEELAHPRSLAEVDLDDFDVVFYPGGHGPMEDLAVDPQSGELLTRALASGKPLALVCHGPAAALAARNPDGSWPFRGYEMTALSNREERFNRFARKAPWLLEDRLRGAGAAYRRRRLPLLPFVVVDRNLYSGQNPASAGAVAKRLVHDVDGRTA